MHPCTHIQVSVCCPWRTCSMIDGSVKKSVSVKCGFQKGRWVQVQLLKTSYLTLCEVQVADF